MEEGDASSGNNPRMKASHALHGHSTLYGQQYVAVVFDEAHKFNNKNKAYWAAMALCKHSQLVVAMTATPVNNRPMVG